MSAVYFCIMSRFHSYINTAINLVENYRGDVPFSNFIKQFFSTERKFGSSDRKQISSLCYCYFRAAFAFDNKLNQDNMVTALFLCQDKPSALIKALKPDWENLCELTLDEKLALVSPHFSTAKIFPFKANLNEDINHDTFGKSFLIQPHLFTRIRPKQKNAVLRKLRKSKLPYQLLNQDNCIAFPPATRIDHVLEADKEIVVQDLNSQLVLNYLTWLPVAPKPLAIWDCCAASGGKSILLTDILKQKFKLTVSDIRPSSILKLHQRFIRAGIKEYDYFITDIGSPDNIVPPTLYDVIICDAPCTGSGTWSRTPEQLYFFKQGSIARYVQMQQQITDTAVTRLKPGALLVYITCSVFREENEQMAAYISAKGLTLLTSQALYGYQQKADSMYVAVLQKN